MSKQGELEPSIATKVSLFDETCYSLAWQSRCSTFPNCVCDFERMSLFRKLKLLFITVNSIIIVVCSIGFIYGLAKFSSHELFRNYLAGSFLGGLLPTVCVALVIFAVIGIFGVLKFNETIVLSYIVLAAVSLILRILTFLLLIIYRYPIHFYYYIYFVTELIYGALLILLLRFRENQVFVVRKVSSSIPDAIV